jgi:hypothetical protein
MLQLIQKLRPFVTGGANTVGALYKHYLDTRTNHSDSRINALEKSLELQVALNETLEVQIKIVQALLENVQKTLRVLTIGMVATATIAALALAVAILK